MSYKTLLFGSNCLLKCLFLNVLLVEIIVLINKHLFLLFRICPASYCIIQLPPWDVKILLHTEEWPRFLLSLFKMGISCIPRWFSICYIPENDLGLLIFLSFSSNMGVIGSATSADFMLEINQGLVHAREELSRETHGPCPVPEWEIWTDSLCLVSKPPWWEQGLQECVQGCDYNNTLWNLSVASMGVMVGLIMLARE